MKKGRFYPLHSLEPPEDLFLGSEHAHADQLTTQLHQRVEARAGDTALLGGQAGAARAVIQ